MITNRNSITQFAYFSEVVDWKPPSKEQPVHKNRTFWVATLHILRHEAKVE